MKYVIASGPVIIEDGKVLLNRHGSTERDKNWKFIGGMMEYGETPEETAVRKAKEDMGVVVELIKPLSTRIAYEKDQTIIMIHYLAKRKNKEIKPSSKIKEWEWIPAKEIVSGKVTDLTDNIKPIVEQALK